MSVPHLPPVVNRRLSRSNSTSSSVATIKQISSKIGHRKSLSQSKGRPTSSDSINQHFSVLDAAAEHSNPRSHAGPAQDRGRSPNVNINRWSHSTTSSMGVIDNDVLRQVTSNATPARPLKPEVPTKPSIIPKSQYAIPDPVDSATPGFSSRRSPGRVPRSSRRNSPEASRIPYASQDVSGRASNFTTTPDVEDRAHRADGEYFGTTVLDHARSANKFGQSVESIALQVTSGPSGHLRQKRSDPNKLGNGLYQAANSSHISLQQKPTHSRSRRDRSENGSKDTAAGSSMSSARSETSRSRGHRSPTQKNMLSKALSKANQAVLMDNAQDIQGAIQAYEEACNILEQVMVRSSDTEDRKKLSTIRQTYSTRIAELYDLDNTFDYLQEPQEPHVDKELPQAPFTTRYLEGQNRISFDDLDDMQPSILVDEPQRHMQIPMRQESLLPQIYGGESYIEQQLSSSTRPKGPVLNSLTVPMDAKYMPEPLSPRRLPSPHDEDQSTPTTALRPVDLASGQTDDRISSESTSWLDTLDETNSSRSSSRSSSMAFASRDDELVSAIEAELDAAVDAAYDDEESYLEVTPRPSDATALIPDPDPDPASELHAWPSSGDMRTLATQPSQESVMSQGRYDHLTREYLDEEAEEEEEILEMMMTEGFTFDQQNQQPGAMSSLPRQSDSSGFSVRSSGRTWESSMTTATQGTALSTLAESPEIPQHALREVPKETDEATLSAQDTDVFARKQASPLPPLPAAEKPLTVPLRDRRLSGQSALQLKIETFTRRGSVSQQGQFTQAPVLDIPSANESQHELARSVSGTNISVNAIPITPITSIHSADSMTDSPSTPGMMQLLSNSTVGEDDSSPARPNAQRMLPLMRKNTSTSNLRSRNLSLATSDLNNDRPPTPGSALFPTHTRQGTSILTPAVPQASPNVFSSTAVGGMYIFDHIADPPSPMSPRSPDAARSEPFPLEPCPESFLLRPFWLMRCLYQTLAHPKGGYVSTKLFIPRDIWRVKGVKIKAIDDKVGQCDMLTAALLKLAKVDTLDADAVLEELQFFDAIIDNVRTALVKKLGNDVGLTGTLASIKNSPLPEDQDVAGAKSGSSVKSLASSWGRKLRSKSSNTVLIPSIGLRKDGANDLNMPTLPMTRSAGVTTSRTYKTQRHPPPTPTGMPHVAPQNANYMSSLARLFDAVQVLDSIARQVEDPGLKATNKTQVGLELSIRGAAEFFSFYVIRFALADIGLMIDKYLKRNSEWIMI